MGSMDVESGENTFANLVYSAKIFVEVSLAINLTIWDLRKGWALREKEIKNVAESDIMYYKDFMIWIKRWSCKLFITHKLDVSGSREGFFSCISFLLEFPIQEINNCTIKGEEKHSKNYF